MRQGSNRWSVREITIISDKWGHYPQHSSQKSLEPRAILIFLNRNMARCLTNSLSVGTYIRNTISGVPGFQVLTECNEPKYAIVDLSNSTSFARNSTLPRAVAVSRTGASTKPSHVTPEYFVQYSIKLSFIHLNLHHK